MKNVFMKSQRLSFAIWEESDLELAKKLWGNDEVAKYISANSHFDNEQIINRLKTEVNNYKNYNVQYWPIFLTEQAEFVGCCGLRPYDLDNNIYEIGIHLLPDYWRCGIATEALTKVIEYAFNEMKVNNLFAGHNPKNVASKELLKKIGFNFVREEYYAPTGLMHPSYLYKIDNKKDIV